MQYRETLYQLLSSGQKVDFHLTPVGLIDASFDQAEFFATIQQGHYAVVFGLQLLGEFADARPVFSVHAFDV